MSEKQASRGKSESPIIVDGRRLGGRFKCGDRVLVHWPDAEPTEAIVTEGNVCLRGTVEVEAQDEDRYCFRISSDQLWLVNP